MAVTRRAYMNHGRWIAQCRCGEASEFPVGELTAHCHSCGRGWRLEWPAEADRITQLLTPRPVANQNWRPGETTAFLEAENVEHGIGSAA